MDATTAPNAKPGSLANGQIPPQQRILHVARELFCRNGIHATGIDRILSEAGASKMTLYNRFGSKEALLREVLELEGAEWRSTFFGAVERAAPDPAGRLQAVVPALGAWFDGGRFYGCAFMNAAAEHAKGGGGEPWLRGLTARHHAAILAFLGNLADAAGHHEPALLAREVLLVIDGAIAALMVTSDRAVLDIAARNLRAVLAQSAA